MRPTAAIAAVALGLTVVLASSASAEPPAPTLSLHGRVAADLSYRVRVDHATTANDQACKFDDQITGMWVPLVESRFHDPVVEAGEHRVTVPLTSGAAGPCGWRPVSAFLCIGWRGDAQPASDCKPLLVVRPGVEAPAADIKVICDPERRVCVTPDNTDPVQEVGALAGDLQLDLTVGPRR